MHSSLFLSFFSSSFFSSFQASLFLSFFFRFFFMFSFFHVFHLSVFFSFVYHFWFHFAFFFLNIGCIVFFLYPQTIPRPNGSKLVLPLFDQCFPFWVLEAGMARLRKARREPQGGQNEEHGQGKARREPQGGQNEELLE